MNLKPFYLLCCVLGLILPWAWFAPWLMEFGLAPARMFAEAFASPVSAAAWADLLVSVVLVVVFIVAEGRRIGMPRLWLPILGVLLAGLALGLGLFLLLREMHVDSLRDSTANTA